MGTPWPQYLKNENLMISCDVWESLLLKSENLDILKKFIIYNL